jgi:glycosyltransferase involved in cell wall biosynthesis
MSSSKSPAYIADVGVIGLGVEAWGGYWQPRHHVLTRLAQYFNVVWCNPARSWRKFFRHGGVEDQHVDNSAITPGLTVYNPAKWLPAIGRPRFLVDWTLKRYVREAESLLLNLGCRKIILYVWRPWYGLALDLIDYDLSCYHIDDEYTFSIVEKPIANREARLISRVDQVFIHSPALLEKKGRLNPRTAFVPNGVDYQAYASPQSEPVDLKPIPHPRIGYVGVIKHDLDLPLLIAIAERHRQWSFVFVGPQRNPGKHAALIRQLSLMPNVYFLGGKPVQALPAYVQHLDVCMLCYEVSDYTKFIYPLKMHEYLASGRPVVSAPIRSVQEFAHVIKIAHTVEDWSQALADMLVPAASSSEQAEVRRKIARQHDWDVLVNLIARTLCSQLGPAYLQRFETIPPQRIELTAKPS